MDIVLFGIQGSGKGTLGKAAADKYGFEYFETGAELRHLSKDGSELGNKIKEIIEAGHLVPDEIVMEILRHFMKNVPADRPVIIDGIPRTLAQAKLVEEVITNMKRDFKGIYVDVPEDIALKRLTTRRVCAVCKEIYPADFKGDECAKCGGTLITRSDDHPEAIKTRIEAYLKETMPVIKKYDAENKLITMDGTVTIPEAVKKINQIIENHINNPK